MVQCLISYGANLEGPFGPPRQTIYKALEKLRSKGFNILEQSKSYCSESFPNKNDPKYLNGCLKIEVDLEPTEVLRQLKHIERRMGRLPGERWGARICDLDLLSVDSLVYPNIQIFNYWRNLCFKRQEKEKPNELLLPHPRIQDRAFVLRPLLDIAPNWKHPVLHLTVEEMFEHISKEKKRAVTLILA